MCNTRLVFAAVIVPVKPTQLRVDQRVGAIMSNKHCFKLHMKVAGFEACPKRDASAHAKQVCCHTGQRTTATVGNTKSGIPMLRVMVSPHTQAACRVL